MAGTSSQPPSLAAYVQAGIDPKRAQRLATQQAMLSQLLSEMGNSSNLNIRTPAALGLNLLADLVAQRGKAGVDTEMAGNQRLLAQALYPDDQKAQLRWMVDPEGMNKSAAAAYAPLDVRAGNTMLNAPTPEGRFTAPVLHDDGGVYSTQTPTGVSITGSRPMNYQEQTGQQGAQTQAAQQAEAARHNLEMEGIDKSKIPIELGMMNIAMRNAGTSAGQLGLGQSNSPTFAVPQGYRPILPGQN